MHTEKYHWEIIKALNIARKIAKENMNPFYNGAHLLKAILNRELSLLKDLEKRNIDVFYLEEWAEIRIEECEKSTKISESFPDTSIDNIFVEAQQLSSTQTPEAISLWHIFIAISTQGVVFSFEQMKTYPVTRQELLQADFTKKNSTNNHPVYPQKTSNSIEKYCINRIKVFQENQQKEHSLIGRELEIEKITEIMCRFKERNILILGETGVGKSKLIEGFISAIVSKDVPDSLSKTQIFELDLSEIFLGTSYKTEIDDRIKTISQQICSLENAILLIEDIHLLLSDDGNIANILKSEISKGLTLIATSSPEEYTQKIEKHKSLERLFQKITLEEANENTLFRIIKEVVKTYENHHQICIEDNTIFQAIKLSKRFLKEKKLPAIAIDLIDQTMAMLKTQGVSFLKKKEYFYNKITSLQQNTENLSKEELEQKTEWLKQDIENHSFFYLNNDASQGNNLNKKSYHEKLINYKQILSDIENQITHKRNHINENDLAIIISQKTNIPVTKLKFQEKNRLSDIENIIKQRVIGQDQAISTVSDAILENRSGLSKSGQPIGSFFFLGPTGTGKTELAKSLAEFLFSDENAIIRFDMSEFKEEHSAALLYGAPPGYVGYQQGGLLVNKIRQKPYSIVLFDEIEKAHSSVFDVFLQIMDEGKLHDKLGKEGDFSNALILFTSNIGSNYIMKSYQERKEIDNEQLTKIMNQYFRPEFLARLTEIIPFNPINEENLQKIFEIHLKKELLDLTENLNIKLIISDSLKVYLSKQGYDINFGVRPIKNIIKNKLKRPLAKKIISEEFKEGDTIYVDLIKEHIIWEKKD